MNLYIIGNGFDLHHGLKTSYRDYREFLEYTNSSIAYSYERICDYSPDYSELWNDIEFSLNIDYEGITEDVISQNYPDMLSDKDTYADAEIEMSNYTDFISDFTGRYFVQWLFTVVKTLPSIKIRMEDLDTGSIFINFNYTDTLECLYSTDKNRIFHIHGDLANLNQFYNLILNCPLESRKFINNTIRQRIQFGSSELSENEVKTTLESQYENDDFYGASLSHAVDKIVEFSQYASKDITKNFDKLRTFLMGKDISEIVVMGHSLCDTDMPYYENFLIPCYKDLIWTFYYHSEKDLFRINQFITTNNLQNYQSIAW